MGYSNAAFHLEFSEFFRKELPDWTFWLQASFFERQLRLSFRVFFFKSLVTSATKSIRFFQEKLFELDAFFGGITQTYPDRFEYNGILQREVERAAAFFKKSIFIWMTSGCSSSDCRRDNRCFHIHIAWSNCWVHS